MILIKIKIVNFNYFINKTLSQNAYRLQTDWDTFKIHPVKFENRLPIKGKGPVTVIVKNK